MNFSNKIMQIFSFLVHRITRHSMNLFDTRHKMAWTNVPIARKKVTLKKRTKSILVFEVEVCAGNFMMHPAIIAFDIDAGFNKNKHSIT